MRDVEGKDTPVIATLYLFPGLGGFERRRNHPDYPSLTQSAASLPAEKAEEGSRSTAAREGKVREGDSALFHLPIDPHTLVLLPGCLSQAQDTGLRSGVMGCFTSQC